MANTNPAWYIFLLYTVQSEPDATVAMDLGEGPWDTKDGAAEFGANEVGFPWVLVEASPAMAAALEAQRERSVRNMLDGLVDGTVDAAGVNWRLFNISPAVLSDPDVEAGIAYDSGAGPFATVAAAARFGRAMCVQWTLVPETLSRAA